MDFSSTNEFLCFQFFLPLRPLAIHIGFEQGRASGEADVEFATHEEAVRAMGRVSFFYKMAVLYMSVTKFPFIPG